MKNLQIIRRYFQVTKADRKISVFLVLSSIMANGPYLFVSLLFSMAIDSLSKGDANRVMLMMVIYFLLKIFDKFFVTHTQSFPAMQKSPVEWIFLCKFTVTY